MTKRVGQLSLWVLVFAVIVALGCSAEAPEPAEEPAAVESAESVAPADPGAEEAAEVEAFLRSWVEQRAAEGGRYAIPPRGGVEASGVLEGFHTVHGTEGGGYSVCVDFRDEEKLYDVDFFLDRDEGGLAVADHYLHKVDGEEVAVEEAEPMAEG